MRQTPDRKFLDDKESFEAIIDAMPDDERETYRSYSALSKEAAFPNRILVVYTLKNGRPQDVEVLRCGRFVSDELQGPMVEVSAPGKGVTLTVEPIRWPGRSIYLAMPQHFDLKWTGRRGKAGGVQFVAHYAILIKSQSKEHMQIDSHTYCVTLNVFNERFPDVHVEY